ncbi:MAG: bifunctional hydroxymethylpyrimidine kinase/phosphomethylpyrimidine kinase [Kiritimatiellales bacterium]|nr:bifunctional hydroxymethylpyrimidine kinase/phosphomethylpyrimidine kinase [Kiritimatiellota bacterium]MBL7012527.1 bifunctional hydroxymethylpyrimidine kinase/phosphomethylpyrimidine kinase [Kiritimatiellales bacterium]
MKKPIVWTIAGSDSGGGAGVQADIKVMNLLGAHACSVITALTAQNTIGTGRLEWVAPDMLSAQLEALKTDLPPAAIKLGMLGTQEALEIIVALLKTLKSPFTVCDPVLISSSGTFLLEAKAWPLVTEKLFPVIDLITPNIPEAEHLLGMEIATPSDIEAAAQKALACGASEVLIKGGHGSHDVELSNDYWSNGKEHAWLSSPRIDTQSSHGTGCVLSSAIATARALGCKPLESIVLAKAYLNQGLRQAPDLGNGFGPLAFNPWERAEEDLPLIFQKEDEPGTRAPCPEC